MKPQKLQKIQDAALSVDLNGSAADKVQEHDLQMLFETTPVEELLKPMKGNSRKYRKYIIQLGKLDKRSPRVREKIVPFAVELYKEGDRIYRDIAACTFQIFLGQVCRNVQQIVGKDPEDIKKISKYSPEAMADLLLKYGRICQNKKEPFRPNALWMVLDMAEMPYPEGKQHQAEALLKKKEKEAREARENKATKESKESKESKETKNGKGAKGERENKETREAAAPAEGPQEEPAARKNRKKYY